MNKLEKEFKKLTPEDVKLALESESVNSEQMMVVRQATPEELQDNLERLGNLVVERSILQEGFDAVKQDYKTADAPLKLRLTELTRIRRHKVIEVEGMVYDIPDYDKGLMNSYDEQGGLLQSRDLRPEEKLTMTVNHNQ